MHSTDAIFLRNGRELGFGFKGQLNDLIFRRSTLQILSVVADRGQDLARVYRSTAVIAAKGLPDEHTEISSLRQIQHTLYAPSRSAVFAEQLKEPGIRFRDEHFRT